MGNRENRTGVYEMPQSPGLDDLFRVAQRGQALAMRTHTVCTVKSYNPATQTVDVTVDIVEVVRDYQKPPTASNPAPSVEQDPVVLVGIPVAWPRTGSGYLTFPIDRGDKGELHVQDRSTERWRASGKAQDPVSMATHSLADSVFHPTDLRSSNAIQVPTDQTAAVLDHEDIIKLGRLAVEHLAKAESLLAAVDGMITAAVLAAAPVVPPAGDGGTAGFVAMQQTWDALKQNVATKKAMGE